MPGDYTKVVNAQNVLFYYTNSLPINKAEGGDELITLFNVELIDESVIDRRNPRAGPIDTPTFSLVEIIADAVLDTEVYNDFKALRKLSIRGGLTRNFYEIDAEAPISGDDFSDTGSFTVRRMHTKAAEQGRYEVSLTLRLVPGTRN